MELEKFRVRNFRNIQDSGLIELNRVTAFVGQNECGKSNLFEALYLLNPFEEEAAYDINEDWPADDWGNQDHDSIVCEATFTLSDQEQIKTLLQNLMSNEKETGDDNAVEENGEDSQVIPVPDSIEINVSRNYKGEYSCSFLAEGYGDLSVDDEEEWIGDNIPKCVYIKDYNLFAAQTELNTLAEKYKNQGWHSLTNEEQTIKIVLDLAKVDIDDFLQKGATAEGRTLRSFDKRKASSFLTKQFSRLWKQKDVRFDIDIDTTTLNIFVEDEGLEMPVRLHRRSTGFQWYVSFAWKFTHASMGQYKNCILLLDEPGIHLHHAGHRDLLDLFDELSQTNIILYSTHLATMLDTAFPERVRIVEVHDHHSSVINGMVSTQKRPMMVIESTLGLSGDMSGLLGNRQTLIVEGGTDAVILHKLSGLLGKEGNECLSDRIYLFPAATASKTPMYAAFMVGNKWDAAVLLDTDGAGEDARKKINELYLDKLTGDKKFRVLMIGNAAGVKKTDAAIEDIFPDEFYIECVNSAYGIAIAKGDLPQDGSDQISKRVEKVLKDKHSRSLDKKLVMKEMMKRFDEWEKVSDLPGDTANKAEKLFKSINAVFN